MGKLLFYALLAAVVWWVVKDARRTQVKPPPPAEEMVRCAQFGVHLPRSESHTSGCNFFCSAEHLRLYH